MSAKPLTQPDQSPDRRRVVVVRVTPQLIRQALRMPEGSEIYGCDWDFARQDVRLFVRHEDLPDVAEGGVVPECMPIITVTVKEGAERTYSWDWNL